MSPVHLSSLLFTLAIMSATPLVAAAEDSVGVRHLQVLRISNSVKNITAVGQNNTDRTLPTVHITYELSDKDGKSLGVQTYKYTEIGPQQAWRISHPTSAPNVASLKILKIETPAAQSDATDQVETAGLRVSE